MPPPLQIDRYQYSQLQSQFERLIESQSGRSVGVRITSSALADLDHDGASNDLFGTAVLQVGSRFKSFVFLLREDGAARFLENSGQALRTDRDLNRLPCMESRPWLCPNSLEEAAELLRSPRLFVREFDPGRAGLEIVIRGPGGRLAVLNSLELFAGF